MRLRPIAIILPIPMTSSHSSIQLALGDTRYDITHCMHELEGAKGIKPLVELAQKSLLAGAVSLRVLKEALQANTQDNARENGIIVKDSS